MDDAEFVNAVEGGLDRYVKQDWPRVSEHDTMVDALASINVHLICDKHGPGEDRCKGCGFVCSAHPHFPPYGDRFVKGGCTCGAAAQSCLEARTAPIVVNIQTPRPGSFWRVVCKVRS